MAVSFRAEDLKRALHTFQSGLMVTWTEYRTNESIRNELEVKENWLRSYVLRQKLKYFGHRKRQDGMGRIILEGRFIGKGRRGRPRRHWERDIEDVLKMSY